ncbi:hypothetical protein V8C26DRAFT_302246 [Trichoderma gracile]
MAVQAFCQLERLGCWAWVHGSRQFLSRRGHPNVQSLRYSCVPTSRCSPIFLLVINIFHFVLDFRFLFLRRRGKGQLLGKSMRWPCGWEGAVSRLTGFQMVLATSSDTTMVAIRLLARQHPLSRGSAC